MASGLQQHPRREAVRRAWAGIAVLVGTFGMMFVSLVFAYLALRLQAPSWPPQDAPALPRATSGWASLALVGAATLHELGRRFHRAGRRAGRWLLGLGALGLLAFVGMEVRLLWEAKAAGLRSLGSAFAGTYYAASYFLLIASLLGAFGLSVVVLRAMRATPAQASVGLAIWGAYLGFLGLWWVALLAGFYLA
jgi:heme/copper-type cytochrome/quinol oxidase subunit 3